MVDVRPEVENAVAAGRPVVALESTLITHGLPWPANFETAAAAEAAVRAGGAVPATIAVLAGVPTVGLTLLELERLARDSMVMKASRRDLAVAVARGKSAGTTVSATLALAYRVGIRVFATGGIGGVHRSTGGPLDLSADLLELARTPALVVCSGAKAILDLPATLEALEALGVPVVGYGTDEFPAFTVRSSGRPVAARVDSPEEAAALARAHRELGLGAVLLCRPVPVDRAIPAEEYALALEQAESAAKAAGMCGPTVTPFLLARLGELTSGRTVAVNRELIVDNAALAGQIAAVL